MRIRIRDPGIFLTLDPGAGINIPDPQHCQNDRVQDDWFDSIFDDGLSACVCAGGGRERGNGCSGQESHRCRSGRPQVAQNLSQQVTKYL
jgi:hypothetical protein